MTPATSAGSPAGQPAKRPPSIWRPFRTPIFRNLILANLASDIGAFMQTVGAAWLMVSLHAGPLYVALTQTASALSFFVFALPAGAIGDIVDRRKLILVTEFWMVGVALVLTTVTLRGLMTPWLLLGLTFALSAGDAVETPSWRALLPELVQKEDLASASALNGIEFNFARAAGPALAGVIIAAVGVGVTFALNVVSFAGVIVVVARWRRPKRIRTTPTESVTGAMVAALRYVRYSPSLRGIIMRAGLTMFFASALLALMPSVARSVSDSPTGYGILLGCFGAGAVAGAMAMQPARARWSTETVASFGVVILGAAALAAGSLHAMTLLGATMLVAGAAWIVFISLVNALMQTLAPDWVRARVLAIFMLVFQGSIAAGSAFWGVVAARVNIQTSLSAAGIGVMLTVLLGRAATLPNSAIDAGAWSHWRMPSIDPDAQPALEVGPVLVTAEYSVPRDQKSRFLEAIRESGRIRRRDGAFRWGVFQDVEKPDTYLETFLVSSWAEHLRQHERSTNADRSIEDQLARYVTGEPTVRHFVSTDSDR